MAGFVQDAVATYRRHRWVFISVSAVAGAVGVAIGYLLVGPLVTG